MYRPALLSGFFFCMLGVIIGAFAAHSLKPLLSAAQQQTFETGVRYQMYMAFALIAIGLLGERARLKQLKVAFVLFVLAIVCFSGSLYALSLLQMQGVVGLGGLGIITPIGGLLAIAGFVSCMLSLKK